MLGILRGHSQHVWAVCPGGSIYTTEMADATDHRPPMPHPPPPEDTWLLVKEPRAGCVSERDRRSMGVGEERSKESEAE